MEALYATNPVFVVDEFSDFPNIAIIWLAPISIDEAAFIEAEGWSAFEEMLEIRAADPVDVFRKPCIP